jgi:DnaJ-class molecular chaperone
MWILETVKNIFKIKSISVSKVCKGCNGVGWHRSNVSKKFIKCPRCKGLGNER